jgi:hypothetical protein
MVNGRIVVEGGRLPGLDVPPRRRAAASRPACARRAAARR